MMEINTEGIPILPIRDPDGDWMMGAVQPGMIVFYPLKDRAVLVLWSDIANAGLSCESEPLTGVKTDNCREIEGPTKSDG